jgi:hypothetical protein
MGSVPILQDKNFLHKRKEKTMTYQEKRKAAIARHKNNVQDLGGKGRAFELECARAKSHKTKVAEQNEVDVHIKMEVKGKIAYIPAECKTNGGRVDELLNGTTKAQYVIYRLDFTQKLKNSVEVRTIPPVVIPVNLFLALLQDVNAIKAINKKGILDGYGIQVSSKKLYTRLLTYIDNYGDCVLFDNEKTFDDWAFEGIEI